MEVKSKTHWKQATWNLFTTRLPEINREIELRTEDEIVLTKAEIIDSKYVLKCIDGNKYFLAYSPVLLEEKASWRYAEKY